MAKGSMEAIHSLEAVYSLIPLLRLSVLSSHMEDSKTLTCLIYFFFLDVDHKDSLQKLNSYFLEALTSVDFVGHAQNIFFDCNNSSQTSY